MSAPIACSLDAAALGDRLGELTAVGRSTLRSVRREGRRAELRFAPEAHDRLAAIVAAEAACCPFLQLDLDGSRLAIDGPPDAAPVIDELVAAFSS